jgi:predicted RNA-binding protein with RPS1 domain
MDQIAIPVEVTAQEISREKSLGGAIELCVKAAGYEPKEVQSELKMDKAQFSRWASGGEGVVWPKLAQVMDFCGNEAPVLWMLYDRGFDLSSIRKLESETEKENRRLREENAALRRVLVGTKT